MEKIKLFSLQSFDEEIEIVSSLFSDIYKEWKSLPDEEKKNLDLAKFIRERIEERIEEADYVYRTIVNDIVMTIEAEARNKGYKEFKSLDLNNFEDVEEKDKVFTFKKPLRYFYATYTEKEYLYNLISDYMKVDTDFIKRFEETEPNVSLAFSYNYSYGYLSGIRDAILDRNEYLSFETDGNIASFVYTNDREKVVDFYIERQKDIYEEEFYFLKNCILRIKLTDGFLEIKELKTYDEGKYTFHEFAVDLNSLFEDIKIEDFSLIKNGLYNRLFIEGSLNITKENFYDFYCLDRDYSQDCIPSWDTIKEKLKTGGIDMKEKIKLSSLILENEIEDAVINAVKEVAKKYDELPEEERDNLDIVSFIEEKFKEKFEDYDFAYNKLIDIINSNIDYLSYHLGRTSYFIGNEEISTKDGILKGKKPIWAFDLDREGIYNLISDRLGVSLEFSKSLYNNDNRLTTGAYSFLEGIKNSAINNGAYFNYRVENDEVSFVYTEDREKVIDMMIDEMKLNNRNFLDLLNGLTNIRLTDGYIGHGGVVYDSDDMPVYKGILNWKEMFENDEIEITDIKPYGMKGKIDLTVDELIGKYSIKEDEEVDIKNYIPSLDTVKEVAIRGIDEDEDNKIKPMR